MLLSQATTVIADGTSQRVADILTWVLLAAPAVRYVVDWDMEWAVKYATKVWATEYIVWEAKETFRHDELGRRPSDEWVYWPSYGAFSSHVSMASSWAIWTIREYDNPIIKAAAIWAVTYVAWQRMEWDHHTLGQVTRGALTAVAADILVEEVSGRIWYDNRWYEYLKPIGIESTDVHVSPMGNGGVGVAIRWTF